MTKIVLNGLSGNDTLKADHSVEVPLEIRGGSGNDWIQGGTKNDFLYGGLGGSAVNISAETGRDTIYGLQGNDFIQASYYMECKLYGHYGNDTLVGSNGNDTLYGEVNDDSIIGNIGDDLIYGGAGRNTIAGGDGNDVLVGGADQDSVLGGNGADWLEGAAGLDTLLGEAGNDTLLGGAGADRMSGGAAIDTVSYTDRSQDLTIDADSLPDDGEPGEHDNVYDDVEVIKGGSGNDRITAGPSASQLIGNDGADTLRGGAANDILSGGWGNDVLHGMAGDDDLFGFDGNDNLVAGPGDDSLNGGAGSDTLVAVGGGVFDTLMGGTGDLDSFWMDTHHAETSDWEVHENAAGAVHTISSFANGPGIEPNGEDLEDPTVADPSQAFYIGSMLTTGNPLFGSAGPVSADVDQAGLRDCWFLATLGAVASQDPNLIRQSVVELGDGTYAVRFWDGDDAKFYRVDADLPVFSAAALAYAGTGQEGAMWVAIMEKAYAFHEGDGSYEGIEGGYSDTAYDDLHMQNFEIDVDDDNVLQTIADHLAAGHAVTIDTVSGNSVVGDSLVLGHVYTVTWVNVSLGLIGLRNPWGVDSVQGMGQFQQGDDDGNVSFAFNQAFRDLTDYFWIGHS